MKALETLTAEYLKNVRQVIEQDVRQQVAAATLGKLAVPKKAVAAQPAAKKADKKADKKVAYTYTFEAKACPVCGKMNKGRRWRYYCGEHRKDDPQNKAE
jgi:hypothetical protein